MVAGKEASPKDVKNTEQLKKYWGTGMGAAKINWGTEGDFSRCVMNLSRHLKDPQGYCAQLHHDVLGYWPATHAKMDRGKAKGAAKKAK